MFAVGRRNNNLMRCDHARMPLLALLRLVQPSTVYLATLATHETSSSY